MRGRRVKMVGNPTLVDSLVDNIGIICKSNESVGNNKESV